MAISTIQNIANWATQMFSAPSIPPPPPPPPLLPLAGRTDELVVDAGSLPRLLRVTQVQIVRLETERALLRGQQRVHVHKQYRYHAIMWSAAVIGAVACLYCTTAIFVVPFCALVVIGAYHLWAHAYARRGGERELLQGVVATIARVDGMLEVERRTLATYEGMGRGPQRQVAPELLARPVVRGQGGGQVVGRGLGSLPVNMPRFG
jgi:hypothetical protein